MEIQTRLTAAVNIKIYSVACNKSHIAVNMYKQVSGLQMWWVISGWRTQDNLAQLQATSLGRCLEQNRTLRKCFCWTLNSDTWGNEDHILLVFSHPDWCHLSYLTFNENIFKSKSIEFKKVKHETKKTLFRGDSPLQLIPITKSNMVTRYVLLI